MPKRERFPSPQDRLRFPSFGKRAGGFRLRISLNEKVSTAMPFSDMAGCILVSKEEN